MSDTVVPSGREAIARVAVVGGGSAGLVAALALARAGADVALIAPDRGTDPRTTALMDGSVNVLKALGVWARVEEHAAPLRVMRLVDGTRRLIRAPEVSFGAREAGLDAFAWNVENLHLNAALDAAVADDARITRLTASVTGVGSGALRLSDGRDVAVDLVAAADGRNSTVRKALGIATRSRSYPQVAVTATLSHERPHDDVSTEFHTETGPFTLVPLPGRRCSVVCVVAPTEAERLMALDESGFGREMERRARSLLGAMRPEGGRGSFPLAAITAQRFAGERAVLMGEAAHVIPPIGAQGLNLGIRDAATLAELVADAARAGQDIGGAEVTEAYQRRRQGDIGGRTFAVDLFNRSLLSDLLPVQGLRGLALWALDTVPALRRAAMREGVGPTRDVPRLVAGQPL